MNKNYFLLLLLYIPFFLKAQHKEIVDIPDTNFKFFLVRNTSINTNRDSEIQVSEAEAYTGEIHISSNKISNLKGIEAFINLTSLDCSSNDLTNLDISKNIKLKFLFCYDNQLTSLDVTKNTLLEFLSCFDNKLMSIDVSMNSNLWCFDCSGNQISNLDLSMNHMLTDLECDNNQLKSLNVKNGNNNNILFFNASDNENLTCIQVDEENTLLPICNKSNYKGWCKDDKTNYRKNCKDTSNENNEFNNDVFAFPNPVIDKLIIEYSGLDKLKSIRLYSVNKEKVIETNERTIDVSGLPQRMYLLEIEDTKNKIARKKILKN